jgi:hypothetical protein
MNQDALTNEAIARIVDENLPKWKKACLDTDASCVILSQRSFSTTDNDLFLLAVAMTDAKYWSTVTREADESILFTWGSLFDIDVPSAIWP